MVVPTLRDAFDQLMEKVSASSRLREKSVCLFTGQNGSRYDGRLMVVGRAVNGWENSHDPIEWRNPAYRLAALDKALEHDQHSKLDWVADLWKSEPTSQDKKAYSTRRSAYWRVIRQIVERLEPAQIPDRWPSHLSWTNLYKVAPVHTGNPSASLARVQLDSAATVLRCELETQAPRRVLFLTGHDWFDPFSRQLGFRELTRTASRLTQSAGFIALAGVRVPVVVARHPQGKPEWEYVNQVTEAFSILKVV